MRSRIGIIVLSAFVLSGYTRCDPLEPPANPVFVNLQSEQICMRGNYSSISRDRWENVVTGAILTNREYQRIPDVDVSLEPGQCFVLPDCAGADPVGLGYFRDSGFNFIDPTPRLLFDLGVRSRDIGGAGFAYLFYDPFTQQYLGTSANLNQRAYLSELPQDSTIGGEDKLVLCARDDAPPTDTALRGWVMVGQTPDDRELNPFAANDGYAVIRYIVDILEASPPPPDPPLVVTLDDGDIGYTVTRDTPIEAVAAITGAAADSTVRCEWAITDAQNPDGLLLIADPGACSASLSLNPDALPENGVLIDFRVTAREFDVDDNQLDVASDASVAIASVQIVSEPVLDLATPVTLYTANGREQILTAEVSGIGDDAARVACGWSAATLQIMPPDGVSPDAASRYPAELNADGTYACAARARLPEDYFPVDGDSFGFTAQAFAIDDADAAIAGSDPANGTLLVSTFSFPVAGVDLTPVLNVNNDGVRPRYDGNVLTAVTVAGDSPIARVRAAIRDCSTTWATDCTPIDLALATPANAASIDLPVINGADGGRLVTVDLTIEGEDGSSAQDSVTRDFWPTDSGLGIACERRYNAGRLEIELTLVDEGLPDVPGSNPPVPYTLGDLFDVRWSIFQRGLLGWQTDETNSVWNTFTYLPPTLDVFDDGRYQVVVTASPGFVDTIQAASLIFDTTGNGPDNCPLAAN